MDQPYRGGGSVAAAKRRLTAKESGDMMATYELDGVQPEVDASAWVADSAQVIGRVHLAAGSAVCQWYQLFPVASNVNHLE